MSWYMGIDPGESGAIAVFDDKDFKSWVFPFKEMGLREIFGVVQHHRGYVECTALESVHSMPGQGVASTFKFGMHYGALRMALASNGMEYLNPTPTQWKKRIDPYLLAPKLPQREKKNRAKEVAKAFFPHEKITHASADALLLAVYARMVSRHELGYDDGP